MDRSVTVRQCHRPPHTSVCSRVLRLFLHSVLSALLGVALVLVVAAYVFVEFFLDPSRLRTNQHFLGELASASCAGRARSHALHAYCVAARNDSSVWFIFLPMAPLSSAAAVIPALAAVTVALALLSSVLLSHLLCFHVYLSRTHTVHQSRHARGQRDRVGVCACAGVCVCVCVRACVQCGTGSAPTSTLYDSVTVTAGATPGQQLQQLHRSTLSR